LKTEISQWRPTLLPFRTTGGYPSTSRAGVELAWRRTTLASVYRIVSALEEE